MELKGEFEVKSDRRKVSSFISNIDKVTAIIPDVQSIERVSDSSARLVVKAGQSAIKGKFNLLLEVTRKDDGSDFYISAMGSGTTGSLDLKAEYSLSDAENGRTSVRWAVSLTIGGMIATMGSRVIDKAAEKYISVLTSAFKTAFEA